MSGARDTKPSSSRGGSKKKRVDLKVDTLTLGPFQTNTYVVTCEATKKAAVIDPGFHGDRIAKFVRDKGVAVEWVLLTHGHVDHVSALGPLLKELQSGGGVEELKVAMHKEDLPFLDRAPEMALMFGFSAPKPPQPQKVLKDGDEVVVGELRFKTIHTPGHTPGGVSFLVAGAGVVFVGDTLFYRGIGRTDLPGGSFPQLRDSIRGRLYSLPPATKVYTGHGPPTTIREERVSNPFVTK